MKRSAKLKLPSKTGTAFVRGLGVEQRRIVAALRKLVSTAAPEAVETVLWRSLSYHRPQLGGRVAGAVCLITPRPDCVHLGFIHGAALPDPRLVLRGNASMKRFVRIQSRQDIRVGALRDLIRSAARFDPRNPLEND